MSSKSLSALPFMISHTFIAFCFSDLIFFLPASALTYISLSMGITFVTNKFIFHLKTPLKHLVSFSVIYTTIMDCLPQSFYLLSCSQHTRFYSYQSHRFYYLRRAKSLRSIIHFTVSCIINPSIDVVSRRQCFQVLHTLPLYHYNKIV